MFSYKENTVVFCVQRWCFLPISYNWCDRVGILNSIEKQSAGFSASF